MLNYVSIAGGVLMPQIGYGVYQFSKGTHGNSESRPAHIAAADERRRAALAANAKKARRAA